MAQLDATIVDAAVDSTETQSLPPQQRRLSLEHPLRLGPDKSRGACAGVLFDNCVCLTYVEGLLLRVLIGFRNRQALEDCASQSRIDSKALNVQCVAYSIGKKTPGKLGFNFGRKYSQGSQGVQLAMNFFNELHCRCSSFNGFELIFQHMRLQLGGLFGNSDTIPVVDRPNGMVVERMTLGAPGAHEARVPYGPAKQDPGRAPTPSKRPNQKFAGLFLGACLAARFPESWESNIRHECRERASAPDTDGRSIRPRKCKPTGTERLRPVGQEGALRSCQFAT
jgi:hypothetical protein